MLESAFIGKTAEPTGHWLLIDGAMAIAGFCVLCPRRIGSRSEDAATP